MKNFDRINVTPELRRCFERANIIADVFNDEYVRTAYIMLAILLEPTSLINKSLSERGIYTNPKTFISVLLDDKESFEVVFGKKAADKYFSEESEEGANENVSRVQETANETKNVTDTMQLDLIKGEVEKVILDMLTPVPDFGDDINIEIMYSDKLQAICEDAATRCLFAKQNYLDVDNLTYSIFQNSNSSAYKMIKNLLDAINEEYSLDVEIDDIIEFIVQNGNIHVSVNDDKNILVIPKNLESCCTVLNTKFEANTKSDILGREDEIFKLWNIFSKRTKRNAILLGEAGVGKTAIIEALVQQIVNGTCPEQFRNYTVLELDVGGTVAGTKYRGELEEKLTKLKKFLENTPNIILFIDEIHQLIGAGSSESSGFDMSGALKPILARGDVVCVGATTIHEYELFIKKEQAFKRRFEPVIVKEPTHKEVANMVSAKVESLSKYHNVTLEDGLLDYIIVCASAFNLTGTNPDKTIDLCDRSMAIAKMRNSRVVQKQDVDKVYNKNYEKFNKWSDERKKLIAYHEASHYVIGRITSLKDEEEVIAVSIVPGEGFLGAYIFDIMENTVEPTYDYYFDKIMALVAGREGQSLFCESPHDSGASSDLYKATEIAKKIIIDYDLLFEKEVFWRVNESLYTDFMKEKLQEACNNILNEAIDKVCKILLSQKIKVENVANLLLERKIATAKELEEAFNKE